MKKSMFANRPMTYGTRRLMADEPFEAERRDAKILTALGRARYAEADGDPIPADWQRLSWPDLRSLAAKVSDKPIKSKADATAAIDAEIARRAGK